MGSTITTVKLRRIVTVECEHCAKAYYYIGEVAGQKETSFASFRSSRAAEIARERAERRAERKNAWLKVVKCPFCGQLQSNMLKRTRNVVPFGIGFLVLGVVQVILSAGGIVALAVGLILFAIWAKKALFPPSWFTTRAAAQAEFKLLMNNS